MSVLNIISLYQCVETGGGFMYFNPLKPLAFYYHPVALKVAHAPISPRVDR